MINDLEKTTENWKLFLYTSGTTGTPKEVGLTWKQLTRNIKKNNKHSKDKWALAYNPAHYAGIQVILQAMLNRNLLVNIFDSPPEKIENILKINDGLYPLKRHMPYCELQLGKRGLYPNINASSTRNSSSDNILKDRKQLNILLYILSYADGKNNIVDISNRSGFKLDEVKTVLNICIKRKLIKY